MMTREALLQRIREIGGNGEGLFRIHKSHPEIYARARRMFGSWSEAVKVAGFDYESAVRVARNRSREAIRARSQKVGSRG